MNTDTLLFPQVSAQVLCIVGSIVAALGTIGLGVIEPSMNYWLIAFSLFVVGLGNGIFVRFHFVE